MKELWFLFDLDKDGLLDERDWSVHRARSTAQNGLFAIRLGGRGDLSKSNVLWRYDKSLPNIPSPLLYQGVLYVLKEGGILTTLNPSDGAVIKQARLEGAVDSYFASPVAADDKVFTLSQSGKIVSIKAAGNWEILALTDLGEECYATPAIAGGRIYVRSQNTLYCFSQRS
jgi:outer membrane protein assembly factor BamB